MTWILVLLLAVAAVLASRFLFRLPRQGLTLFASAIVFGLAGYAAQGNPDMPASPVSAPSAGEVDGEALVAARRGIFDTGQPASRFILIADGFARRGQFAQATQLLQGAVAEEPDNAEAWVAMANALVEHADGQLTPAALHAFGKAEQAQPGHPGTGYFLGVALIRSGRVAEARSLWQAMLEAAPPDAPWRAALAAQLARLDALLGQARPRGEE